MSDETLKPCAHCGSSNVEFVTQLDAYYHVRCHECLVSTTSSEDADGTLATWNRRAPEHPLRALELAVLDMVPIVEREGLLTVEGLTEDLWHAAVAAQRKREEGSR